MKTQGMIFEKGGKTLLIIANIRRLIFQNLSTLRKESDLENDFYFSFLLKLPPFFRFSAK